MLIVLRVVFGLFRMVNGIGWIFRIVNKRVIVVRVCFFFDNRDRCWLCLLGG